MELDDRTIFMGALTLVSAVEIARGYKFLAPLPITPRIVDMIDCGGGERRPFDIDAESSPEMIASAWLPTLRN